MLVTDAALCAPPKLPGRIGMPAFEPTLALGSRSLMATGDVIGESNALTAFSEGDSGAAGFDAGVLALLDGVACCKVDDVGGVGWIGNEGTGAGGGGVGTRGSGAVSAGV
jgi:hypothetical protein